MLGERGKHTFCFAEDESDPTWTPVSVARGIAPGKNAVTLFQGDGIQGFIDQRSRTPEELTRSLAKSLLAVGNWKLCEFTNAMLVLVPEHYAIYRAAGWNRERITHELHAAMVRPGSDVIQGAHGIGEGIDPRRKDETVNKFWPEGLLIVRAGGHRPDDARSDRGNRIDPSPARRAIDEFRWQDDSADGHREDAPR